MTVAQKVEKVAQDYPKQVVDKDSLKRLELFENEMKMSGLIRPTTYGFPLPDMSGRCPKGAVSTQWDTSCACEVLNMC